MVQSVAVRHNEIKKFFKQKDLHFKKTTENILNTSKEYHLVLLRCHYLQHDATTGKWGNWKSKVLLSIEVLHLMYLLLTIFPRTSTF